MPATQPEAKTAFARKVRRSAGRRKMLQIIEMYLSEKGATEIATKTGVSRSTVYRIIADIMNNQPNRRTTEQ